MKHPDMQQPKRGRKDGDPSVDPSLKPFDVWLNRGLHQIYDDVANEPIPEDLLRLIEDDRKLIEGDDRPAIERGKTNEDDRSK